MRVPRSSIRRAAALMVLGFALNGCSPAPSPQEAEAPPRSEARVTSLFDAQTLVGAFMEDYVAYLADRLGDDAGLTVTLEDLAAYYDPTHISIDLVEAKACFDAEIVAIANALFEHSVRADHAETLSIEANPVSPFIWRVAYLDNQVLAGESDIGLIRAFSVGRDGIVGESLVIGSGGIAPCLDRALTRSGAAEAVYQSAISADVIATSATDATDSDEGGDDVWTRREGFAADPDDPEPISSTGSNKWDIITATDPSALVCVDYLGQGPEEFLAPDKGEYEAVPDAFLFIAHFSDGTDVAIRVYPEIGDLEAAEAEVELYATPLGQLPTILRQGIERFAVRLGDEIATASPGEGISMQAGNARIRLGDNRLEETLFHEAVHTSLDAKYSYTRSEEWLAAQEADGRWLTEYGRNNPDSEDLAETALYAYALVHHPGRIPAEDASAIQDRVAHRIEFIETIIPSNRPIFAAADSTPTC